jgi:predicted transcriptional regulator
VSGPVRRGARRERTDLFAEILEVVKRYHGQARVTRVSYAVGMPVDRLKGSIARLLEFNLLTETRYGEVAVYELTPRGQEFLNVYWKMRAFTELLARDPEGIRDG